MQNVATFQHDDEPTRPDGGTTTRTLVLASRAARLMELAIERLEVRPDADAIVAALGDLRSALHLTRQVTS